MVLKYLKRILDAQSFDSEAIFLVNHLSEICVEDLQKYRCRIYTYDSVKDVINLKNICASASVIFLIDNSEDEFFYIRSFLQSSNYKYVDLFDNYCSYCVDQIYKIEKNTVINSVKREYVKSFFDKNNITSIVISQLINDAALFYKSFSNDLNIIIDNQSVCNAEQILLRINSNISNCYITSVINLFTVLFYKTIMSKSWRSECFFNRNNVLCKNDIYSEIRLLDNGATSIFFEDEDGRYVGSKLLCDYKAYFPASPPTSSFFLSLTNQEELVEIGAFHLLKYYNESIPVINDHRVIGFVQKRNELRFTVKMRWDLIDDETMQNLLIGYDKILISSMEDDLKELYSRLVCLPQKEVSYLSENNYYRLLNGDFDLIISKCEIWDNIPISSIHLKHLYINAYCSQMKKFFELNNINYLFMGIPDSKRIVNHRKRVSFQSQQHVNNIINDNGTFTVADGIIDECEYYHARRKTTDVPLVWNRSIFFYGPCISIGVFALDNETIESYLQRKLNEENLPFRVINCPAPLLLNQYDSAINTLHRIGAGKYRSGDVIIHFGRQLLEWEGVVKDDNEKHDLTSLFNTSENVRKKCFIGHMGAHMDNTGYKIIADYLFRVIKGYTCNNIQKSIFYQFHDEKFENMSDSLKKYVQFLRENKFKSPPKSVIGSVAVNANPFTLGHAHLVLTALKQCDFLYVFVAEEDLSDFSFEVRYALVKQFCDKYSNIKVLPSGRFFASTISFGDYFNRDALKNVSIDATLDCDIFSKVIAKELDISFRVLGEEPNDSVTQQYNSFVKEILEQNGVKVFIIPRYEVDGLIVSAKNVRKHIAERDFNSLKKEVPETTFNYIYSKLK